MSAGGNIRQTFRIFLILDYHFLAYGGANKPGLLFFLLFRHFCDLLYSTYRGFHDTGHPQILAKSEAPYKHELDTTLIHGGIKNGI